MRPSFSVPLVALAWHWRDRTYRGGAVLGVAIAAKLFLWPLVFWLLGTKRYRAALAAALIAAASTIGSWSVIGFAGMTSYPELLRVAESVYAAHSFSVATILAGMGLDESLAPRGAVAVGVVLAASAFVLGRVAVDAASFSIAVIAAILGSPIVWPYYFALLLVPVAVVRRSFSWLWMAVALFYLAARLPRPRLDASEVADGRATGWVPDDVPLQVWNMTHAPPGTWPAIAHATLGVGIAVTVAWIAIRTNRSNESRRGSAMSISAAAPAATREARISIPIAVGLTVLVATAFHIALALRVPVPWITPDELRYSELAKSLGDGRLPSIRDDVTFGFGLGYPLLLAPVWAVVGDVAIAYQIAKVLNSLVMGLTAVPAFLLARRFVGDRSALAAAALSVTIPSLLYAGMLMTEVALYPLFVLALFAIAVALDRPTPATQLAALGSNRARIDGQSPRARSVGRVRRRGSLVPPCGHEACDGLDSQAPDVRDDVVCLDRDRVGCRAGGRRSLSKSDRTARHV